MKKLLSLLLALLLCAPACAEPFYQVSEASVNMDALLEITFCDRKDDAILEKREYGYLFYSLNKVALPFCGAGGVTPGQVGRQSRIGAYREPYIQEQLFFSPTNVVPTGIAPCNLTREDALKQATAIMDALELGEYRLLSITPYGYQKGTVPNYQISFQQTLNGCPVYWFTDNNELWPREYSNLIRICVGDDGLINLDGYWSDLTAIGETAPSLSMEGALERFAAIGIQAQEAEKCYYMYNMGKTAGMVAYPAWRVGNNYLSTGDSWLQIISSPQLVK